MIGYFTSYSTLAVLSAGVAERDTGVSELFARLASCSSAAELWLSPCLGAMANAGCKIWQVGGKLQILRRSLSPGSVADLDPSDEFTGQRELCPEDETCSRMAVFVAM